MNLRRANWVAAAAAGLALAIQSSMGADTLISTGAVWKYLDTGLDGGTAWRTMTYDDSLWPSGAGKLGFGEGDEATVLNTWTANSQQIVTYYFRHSFVVPNPSAVNTLTLRLLRDDGAVVFLNGTEIRRDNMPAGNISYTNLASLLAIDSEERTYLSAQIPPALLVAGNNLLAVEVHQGSTVGGDLGFGLELTANSQTAALLEGALDATNLIWSTGGDAPWFGQTQTTHDGVDAAQSGHVPLGASSWLETTVNGPGLLRYSFQVRTENINSEFKLLVDGAAVHRYSLHLGWSANGYTVPAGRHTLRWLLENPADGGGSSVAWLDQVSYDVVPFSAPQCPWPVQWQVALSNGLSVFKPTDTFRVVHPLPGGGYILGGESYSSANNWDYWAVRVDGEGRVLWSRLFGGASGDELRDVQPTRDGGFLLGGWSSSGIDRSRTSPNYGGYDFWIVRLDADGNKLWDRSFGGAGHDGIYGLQTTVDGGFILGGVSESGVGGNKTSPNHGTYDFWIVRVDVNGNKLWDQSYGGAKRDFWAKARQTRDGGFVVFGTSESEPGGNKTSLRYGQEDAWIVRTDASGSKLWDQSYGGTLHEWLADVGELVDGGLLFAGGSASDADGNKTSPAFGDGDGFVLVLNADGSIRRDQSIGGTAFDWFLSLAPMPDGGFLLGGASQSPVSGNKTSPNVTVQDPWLVRLDASGNKLWDRVAPGGFLEDVKPTADGGVIMAGQSWQDASGFDGWAQKLGPLPEPCDSDGDGIADERDQCPNTPLGAVVNAEGCSLPQLCPCNGGWRNHGEYVRCVLTHAWQFFRDGLLTVEQRREFVRHAIRSDCGKREHEPVQVHLLPLTPEECRRDGIQIILSGDVDSECVIESSSDLKHWLPMQTNSVTITGSEIICPPDAAPTLFFRARLLP